MLKNITKTVWILSFVSLFTDTASEMLYPIMPIYLKTIGFSILLIGILEGVAEATAGFSKGYFGKLSDSSGKRVPFVQLGYSRHPGGGCNANAQHDQRHPHFSQPDSLVHRSSPGFVWKFARIIQPCSLK